MRCAKDKANGESHDKEADEKEVRCFVCRRVVRDERDGDSFC